MYERFVDPGFAGPARVITLFLAIDAVGGERQRLKPLHRDMFATFCTDPIAAKFQALKREIDRFEPLLDPFDKAGMSLDIGHRARHVHFVTWRRRRFLFLVTPILAHLGQSLIALMIEQFAQNPGSLLILGLFSCP